MTASNSREKCRTHHRYGRHGGTARVKGRGRHQGVTTERKTDVTMADKSRYNATRFSKENYALYDADGEAIRGGHQEAFAQTREAADHIQVMAKGRNKGRAYIYDTEISPGNGRLSDQSAHRITAEYIEVLRSQGHQVEGVQYVIHQNTQHTHVHLMFATQKTIQKSDDRSAKYKLREVADRLRDIDKSLDTIREVVEVQQDHLKSRGG
ncbi:hypothetical protein FNU79_17755 [Deinococcus detaillensis]|uniref:MobA/VirD2-like nuclease domain-containing protein n=1 Tax=Deinococcus detaillensis TaxID=2592048 RepID=A0A553UHC3_9DEIO|nr:hypothetical protein [Deinococcus detaillensis]TSA79536.1 hypothetical protein FNU79_17755 [Deinococcus detaillensis]